MLEMVVEEILASSSRVFDRGMQWSVNRIIVVVLIIIVLNVGKGREMLLWSRKCAAVAIAIDFVGPGAVFF